MTKDSTASNRGRRSKVASLIETYELEGIGSEMEQRWTDDEDRLSLRELAASFNQSLLDAALADDGDQPLDGEIENLYRLLTDETVGTADRTRARRRLERQDVDVDGLTGDFVTYQAIRSYLRGHRGAEYSPDETDSIESELDNISQLQGRVDSVIDGKLEQLREADHLTLGDFRTIVSVQVYCEDCITQRDVEPLLHDGGCDCR